jgi:hypothetical protein
VVRKGIFEILSSFSRFVATPSFDTMCPTIFASENQVLFSKGSKSFLNYPSVEKLTQV